MTRDEQWLLKEKYAGEETPEYQADRKRLAQGEPLGYVIGWQPFLGVKIYLDSKPLIPRLETEWWAEQMFKKISNAIFEGPAGRRPEAQRFFSRKIRVLKNGVADFRFLDLCAGSGAIGCTALKILPYMKVFFGEIDPAHEATILKNVCENGLDESRATVRIGDLFEPFEDMLFDFIAINPPYIPADRILPASVVDYEPARALYAGVDGLAIIRRIAAELPQHLTEGGEAWIECDSAHAAAACALFTAQGCVASIRTDQFDAPRVIVVSWPTKT